MSDQLFIHFSLFIAQSGKKGRGIFTTQQIEKDTIIESSPVIVMNSDDRKLLDKTLLHDYIFEWHPDGADRCCMALGWIPLYNHSTSANCDYCMVYEQQTIYIKTLRDIEAGEELTINYMGDWNCKDEVWFETE